jgi:hypothetical protein
MTANGDLIKQMQAELTDIDNLKEALDGLKNKYQEVWDAAIKAADAAHEAIQAENEWAAQEAAKNMYTGPEPVPVNEPSYPSSIDTTTSTDLSWDNTSTNNNSSANGSMPYWPMDKPSQAIEGIAGSIWLFGQQAKSWNNQPQRE